MTIIEPAISLLSKIDKDEIYKKLDTIARVCYLSKRNDDTPNDALIKSCIKRGHESVIEHVSLTFKVVTDIGVLTELTRHRIASYSVESTRYVCYADTENVKKEMSFIRPIELNNNDEAYREWLDDCIDVDERYHKILDMTKSTDIARMVLSKSNKTTIVFTMNLRELRAMLKLRCSERANAHIKQIMIPILIMLKYKLPAIFEDIPYDEEFSAKYLNKFPDIIMM